MGQPRSDGRDPLHKLLAAAAQIDNLEALESYRREVRMTSVFKVPIAHVQTVSVIRAQAVDRRIEGLPITAAFELPRCHARKSNVVHDSYEGHVSMLQPVGFGFDNHRRCVARLA